MFEMNKIKRLTVSGFIIALSVLGISACGSGSGPTTTDNPDTSANSAKASVCTVAADMPADVETFRINLCDNLTREDRCGSCHGVDQSPRFVFRDNVIVAYQEILDYVNPADPASSALVAKVAAGHHCWLADNNVCADIVTGYLENWLGGSNAAGRQIQLVAPVIKDPGDSKNFPALATDNSPNSFAETVHPLLRDNCASCHDESAATPQAPFFANADVSTAYEAAKSKMDLDTPVNSRLVLRLRNEFHNCWTASCAQDAQDMEDEIVNFSGAITPQQIDPQLVTSKALTLQDAIVATGGSRYEANAIATWEFKEGQSNIAYDTSGKDPAINLTLSGNYGWVLGNGIEILESVGSTPAGKAQGSTTASKKLHDLISLTGQYSVEAWVIPGNVTQEMANIISYSQGDTVRNFTLGQQMYNYEFYNRVDNNNNTNAANGEPLLSTADADEDLQATLQHVVMTYDAVNGRRIFVNGQFTGDVDSVAGDALSSWDDSFALVMGNEVSGNRFWKGKIRLAAIHDRVLTETQIQQNYDVGVGLKYFLLFSVSDKIGVADSYIMLEVSQFDNYSYHFRQPTFINLNESWTPASDIVIKGLRIGINGKEAVSGQVYGNLDVVVNSANYTANGQLLSTLGTVIALEKGPDNDEFFLTFEDLDGNANPLVEPVPVAPTPPVDPAERASDIGVRTFDEINATMSAVTGIPVTETNVASTYATYKQQLPAVEDINAFLASHHMAVAQLAMKYCDVLVNTNKAYFAPFDFTRPASTAFDAAGKEQILNPLLEALMNVDMSDGIFDSVNNLTSQPVESEIRDMIGSTASMDLDASLSGDSYEGLVECMTRCAVDGAGAAKCAIYVDDDPLTDDTLCTAPEVTAQDTSLRTEQVVKAACAAALGSAMMLVQ